MTRIFTIGGEIVGFKEWQRLGVGQGTGQGEKNCYSWTKKNTT